jgi:hypothetical protein
VAEALKQGHVPDFLAEKNLKVLETSNILKSEHV